MNQRIDELRTLLRDDPASRRFFLLGDLLRKAGEPDEAAQILAAGLEHHPRYVAAWVSLGRIQLDKAQFSEAERCFARALELDPENAVAARLIGETAERIGEWVRAIKAYKLARALNPGDADLEVRIEMIERRLAGGSIDSLKESIEAVPPTFPESPTPVQQMTPPEPLPVEEPDPEVPEPFPQPVVASRPRQVISVSEDDPFAMTSTGDTGVWMVADDVFAPPETSFDSTSDDVFGAEYIPLPPPERPPEPEPEFVPPPVTVTEPEPEPEPDVVPEPDFSHELPLPTVTLARLALEQDDRPLAEQTLRAVLERDPLNKDAAELLEALDEDIAPEAAEPPPAPSLVSPADLLAAKAQRLKGWMEDIRSASERRVP